MFLGKAESLVCASLLLCSAVPEVYSVPYVVNLQSDKILEHQTQASTGQTTGWWLVHFYTSKGCQKCKGVNQLMDKAAEEGSGGVIYAKIDCGLNPDTAKRFNIKEFPTLILFKNRKMYIFPDDADVTAKSLSHFVENVSDTEEGLVVPEPLSLVTELSDALGELHRENPAALYCVAFLMVFAILLSVLSIIFPRGKFTSKED